MKNTILLLIICFNNMLLYGQLPTEQKAQQEPVQFKNEKALLTTDWDQFGVYAKYSPDQNVLGCWSTALAQILYYHKLQPTGFVSYQCSKGYLVEDSLSKYVFDWKNFAGKLNDESNPEAIEAVSRYSFLTAAAIRKDFGTPRYLQMVNPAEQVEKHFNCDAVFYASFTGDIPIPQDQLELIGKRENISHIIDKDSIMLIIKNEIQAKRPVYFHYGDFTTFGHSTVIDGYKYTNGTFYVHINYGSGGFRTGWYDLFKPIDIKEDIMLRAFVAIKPVSDKINRPK